jgi:chaperone protein DnaJ
MIIPHSRVLYSLTFLLIILFVGFDFPSSFSPLTSFMSPPSTSSFISYVSASRDLYGILGLKRDAGDGEIKRAYRKLSLQYHPDKNAGNEEARQKYMDIQYAHEVLSDPDKRQIYDVDGEEGLKNDQQGGRGGGSIFDLFGMGGGGGGKRKGPDYRMELSVTLEELYTGAARTLRINRRVLCKSCRGTGAADGKQKTCGHCKGKGHIMGVQQLAPGFNIQTQQPCPVCGGRGKQAAKACPICGGSKLIMEEKELEAIIERGMPEGHELKFERASEQSPDWTPGDVLITLKTQTHSRFQRRGNDLHMEQAISLKDALLGFKITIPHLDGHRVTIDQSGTVTQPDSVKKLVGEGMPLHEFSSEHGDLYVKFKIQFPKKLSDQQKDAIKSLLEEN